MNSCNLILQYIVCPALIIVYSSASDRQRNIRLDTQPKKKYNLTDKKNTHQWNYSSNKLLQFAINCDLNLAALLTTVTLGKTKFKKLLILSDSIHVVSLK